MINRPTWQETQSARTRLIVFPHDLGEWHVIHKPGAGIGVATVMSGPSATAPPFILKVLRLENVFEVVASQHEGLQYLMISLFPEVKWDVVMNQINMLVAQNYKLKRKERDAGDTPARPDA